MVNSLPVAAGAAFGDNVSDGAHQGNPHAPFSGRWSMAARTDRTEGFSKPPRASPFPGNTAHGPEAAAAGTVPVEPSAAGYAAAAWPVPIR